MNDKILLNHGSGGKLTHTLINNLFMRYFDNHILKAHTDSAILKIEKNNIAFTTDSYVVNPIFFPGGNIGKLAICGTVNDLAVSGAVPIYISCGFIIEEGFNITELELIVKTMADEAQNAGVLIVTGDTKVVDTGKADKVFINTAGIGILEEKNKHISFGSEIKSGDKIIINGYLGDHGAAILCARNSLEYSSDVQSDCASLNSIIHDAMNTGNVKFMRDATRGGLATVLCELAEKHKFGIEIIEDTLPVRESVRGLCEAFGYDPLFMANEGKVVIVVSADDCNNILEKIKQHPLGKNASVIAEIKETNHGRVIMNTGIGGQRIVDMLAGEQLPRIC